MPLRPFLVVPAVLAILSTTTIQQDESGSDPAEAAPAEIDQTADADSATHDEIRELRDALIKAVNEKDVDALTPLLHEDVVLTAQDGNELSTVLKRDGVSEYMERLLTGPDAPVAEMTIKPVVDELTILHGDDTGIAFGTSSDNYVMADGQTFDLETRWSATIVRESGAWQVASLHVSSNLFDNPVLSAISRLISLAALAAGLGGLLIGYGIARFISRRKSPSPLDRLAE